MANLVCLSGAAFGCCSVSLPGLPLFAAKEGRTLPRFRSVIARTLQFLIAAFSVSFAVLAQTPSGDVVISADTTWPSANYALTSLRVQSGAVLTVGGGSVVTVTNGIVVTGGSSVVLQSANNTAQVNGA